MTSPLFAHECETRLREHWAKACDGQPAEITISTELPLIAGPYTTDGFQCPHGITYWLEPTGEQIAQWAREGVA